MRWNAEISEYVLYYVSSVREYENFQMYSTCLVMNQYEETAYSFSKPLGLGQFNLLSWERINIAFAELNYRCLQGVILLSTITENHLFVSVGRIRMDR